MERKDSGQPSKEAQPEEAQQIGEKPRYELFRSVAPSQHQHNEGGPGVVDGEKDGEGNAAPANKHGDDATGERPESSIYALALDEGQLFPQQGPDTATLKSGDFVITDAGLVAKGDKPGQRMHMRGRVATAAVKQQRAEPLPVPGRRKAASVSVQRKAHPIYLTPKAVATSHLASPKARHAAVASTPQPATATTAKGMSSIAEEEPRKLQFDAGDDDSDGDEANGDGENKHGYEVVWPQDEIYTDQKEFPPPDDLSDISGDAATVSIESSHVLRRPPLPPPSSDGDSDDANRLSLMISNDNSVHVTSAAVSITRPASIQASLQLVSEIAEERRSQSRPTSVCSLFCASLRTKNHLEKAGLITCKLPDTGEWREVYCVVTADSIVAYESDKRMYSFYTLSLSTRVHLRRLGKEKGMHVFSVNSPGVTLLFGSQDASVMDAWMAVIEGFIRKSGQITPPRGKIEGYCTKAKHGYRRRRFLALIGCVIFYSKEEGAHPLGRILLSHSTMATFDPDANSDPEDDPDAAPEYVLQITGPRAVYHFFFDAKVQRDRWAFYCANVMGQFPRSVGTPLERGILNYWCNKVINLHTEHQANETTETDTDAQTPPADAGDAPSKGREGHAPQSSSTQARDDVVRSVEADATTTAASAPTPFWILDDDFTCATPLFEPLTTLPTVELEKHALSIYQQILLFCSTQQEEKAYAYHYKLAQQLIHHAMLEVPELWDEFLCLLIKATNGDSRMHFDNDDIGATNDDHEHNDSNGTPKHAEAPSSDPAQDATLSMHQRAKPRALIVNPPSSTADSASSSDKQADDVRGSEANDATFTPDPHFSKVKTLPLAYDFRRKQAWQLLCLACPLRKPGKLFLRYLRAYLDDVIAHRGGEEQDYAKYCRRCVYRVMTQGDRTRAPSYTELEAVIARHPNDFSHPMSIAIYVSNNNHYVAGFDASTTFNALATTVSRALGMRDPHESGFAMFMNDPEHISEPYHHCMLGQTKVCDAFSEFEAIKTERTHGLVTLTTPIVVFKKRFWFSEEGATPVEKVLVSYDLGLRLRQDAIPLSPANCIAIAARLAQIEYGNIGAVETDILRAVNNIKELFLPTKDYTGFIEESDGSLTESVLEQEELQGANDACIFDQSHSITLLRKEWAACRDKEIFQLADEILEISARWLHVSSSVVPAELDPCYLTSFPQRVFMCVANDGITILSHRFEEMETISFSDVKSFGGLNGIFQLSFATPRACEEPRFHPSFSMPQTTTPSKLSVVKQKLTFSLARSSPQVAKKGTLSSKSGSGLKYNRNAQAMIQQQKKQLSRDNSGTSKGLSTTGPLPLSSPSSALTTTGTIVGQRGTALSTPSDAHAKLLTRPGTVEEEEDVATLNFTVAQVGDTALLVASYINRLIAARGITDAVAQIFQSTDR